MQKHSFDDLHDLFKNKFLLCKVISERGSELLSNEAFLEWLKKEDLDLFEYIVEEYKDGKIKVHTDKL
tara:strand:+ start:302 stop:505 length:204 start_codon:yes stop_codon:yes gene_type:complete